MTESRPGNTTSAGNSLSKSRLRLWLRWLRASRGIENAVRERIRVEHQTTLPRFDVMAALERADGPVTMSALSRQLLVSNGNITAVVDRLVADGLVTRKALPSDRRTQMVSLTRKGLKQFHTVAATNEALINDLLGVFGKRELTELTNSMESLMAHAFAEESESERPVKRRARGRS